MWTRKRKKKHLPIKKIVIFIEGMRNPSITSPFCKDKVFVAIVLPSFWTFMDDSFLG